MIIVWVFCLFQANTNHFPFFARWFAPTYYKEQRAYDDFFRHYKSYHNEQDAYFNSFRKLFCKTLANLDLPETRVNISPDSITQIEHNKHTLEYAHDIEGRTLSDWLRIQHPLYPQNIVLNRAAVEKQLNRDYDASIGTFGVLFTAIGIGISIAMLILDLVERPKAPTADGGSCFIAQEPP